MEQFSVSQGFNALLLHGKNHLFPFTESILVSFIWSSSVSGLLIVFIQFSELQIRGGIEGNSKIIFLILSLTPH